MADRADESTTLEVRELGRFEVLAGGEMLALGGPKQRAVLALLALAAPRGLSIDGIIEGIWGGGPPTAAASSVYSYISNLRSILGGGIDRKGSLYTWNADFYSDSEAFDRAVSEARRELTVNPDRTSRALWDALATWRGIPYADLESIPGLEEERRRLDELRVQAQELRLEAELRRGAGTELIPELEALVGEHPYRERFRGQLMLALYRAGRQAEALRAYRVARETLVDELGIDPSQELQDLELRILQHDESLAVATGVVTIQQAAFLFTDIEHSTTLWDLDPEAMASALAVHDHLVGAAVEEAGGMVFKHTGDGTLSVFRRAEDAARAAEDALRRLRAADWGQIGTLGVRMAIDAGAVDIRDGDYYGPPLNRCARILAAGHAGQVLLSSSAFEELSVSHPPGVQVRLLGPYALRGLVEPERIAQLVFVGIPADFPELRSGNDPLSLDPRLAVGGLPGYELRERLGASAWGSVYRAYQPAVGREVAIRIIGPSQANHPTFIRRFEVEARRLAALTHPHIVPIHDFWRDYNGAYVVMQLLQGGSLRHSMNDEGWDPSIAIPLIRDVGSALAYIHGEGETHGDVRPENVLLDGAGNAYLSDLGLGTGSLLPGDARTLRRSRYRAPETDLTPRADIYSLAILVYELLVGGIAPDGRPLPSAAGFGGAVDDVFTRATARNPGDRFADVAEFLETMEAALGFGGLTDVPRVRTPLRNPFKGLRAFTERDASDFHGREELIGSLLDATRRNRLIAVVGPSGSGKSSAVHAGYVPRLRDGAVDGSEDWLILSMTPGTDPLGSLANALRSVASEPGGDLVGRLEDPGTGLGEVLGEVLSPGVDECLLVVDQLEELFSLCDDEEARERFLGLLGEGVGEQSRLRVVLVLRADFYDRPLAYASVAGQIARGLVTVVPPTLGELTEAIERPAAAAGLAFEPGLPRRIAGDVLGQPGGLPLLQHALTELVERRGADLITGVDYEAIGLVSGAIARRAEVSFGDLEPADRDVARRLLMRLVSVSEDTADTRRRARIPELQGATDSPAAISRVLDSLGTARLLQFDRDPITRSPTVEVAHEALLREWSRLAGWIDEERERLVLARRLRAAREEWEASERNDDYLLVGERLAPFSNWSRLDLLSLEERDFLARSQGLERNRWHARRRRRWSAFAVLTAAAVIAFVLAAFALAERRRADGEADRAHGLAAQEVAARGEAEAQTLIAEEQTRLAEQRALEAQGAEALAKARELAAASVSVGDEDPQLAILLALEAFDVAPPDADVPIEMVFSLREAMYANRLVSTLEVGDGAGSIQISPGGRWFALKAWDTDELIVFELETRQERWRLADAAKRMVAFSPDDAHVLTSTKDALELRAAADGSLLSTIPLECPPGEQSYGAWSPDGGLVAYLGSECDALVLVETDGWTEVHRMELAPDTFMGASFARDEGAHRLLVSEWYPNASGRIFDTDTFEQVARFDTPMGAISPDGTTYFGTEFFAAPWLFDVASGEKIDQLSGSGAEPSTYMSQQFSPDGRLVLIPTEGPMIPVWDVATGEVAHRIPAGHGATTDFAPDGRLFTTSDGTVSIWDLSGSATAEIHTFDTGGTFSMWNARASNTVGSVIGANLQTGQMTAYSFDPDTGELGPSRDLTEIRFPWIGPLGDLGLVLAEIRDGSEVLFVWNPDTEVERVLLDCHEDRLGCKDGLIDHVGRISSVDGSEYALVTNDYVFLAWDADGTAQEPVQIDYGEPGINQLFMSFSDEWIVFRNDWSDHKVFDRAGNLIHTFDLLGENLWHRFDRTGRYALGWGFEGSTSLLDATDWSHELFTEDLGEGLVRDAGFSPSGELVALAIQGGPMRVHTVPDGALVARIPLDSVVTVYWVDEQHIAVGTRGGLWSVVTLDIDELRGMAAGQLMRDFTADECRTYRIDACAADSGE